MATTEAYLELHCHDFSPHMLLEQKLLGYRSAIQFRVDRSAQGLEHVQRPMPTGA